MTWHAPTARFYVARPALQAPAIPATIDPMVQTAAKILACSALRILEDAEARDTAMTEFKKRTEVAPIPPLCDYAPPINFRWPEYVTTPRGRDWWIPSGIDGA